MEEARRVIPKGSEGSSPSELRKIFTEDPTEAELKAALENPDNESVTVHRTEESFKSSLERMVERIHRKQGK